MDDFSTTTATLDQADEEILSATVSDEALEVVASSKGRAAATSHVVFWCGFTFSPSVSSATRCG